MALPTVVITFADGSVRSLSPATIADAVTEWGAVPDGIVRIDFNPRTTDLRGVDFIFSGGDRFWAYPEQPNRLVFGWHRPALDVGTLNEVPETFQEVIYNRTSGQVEDREPTSIPISGTVKQWPHG